MALSTRELLARLLKCEAGGEGENGMRAVASVIVNRTRVPNGEFARVSKGGDFRAIMVRTQLRRPLLYPLSYRCIFHILLYFLMNCKTIFIDFYIIVC